MLHAIDAHDKGLGPPADEMLDPGDPECALAGQSLQSRTHRTDDRGVHADAGHQDEILRSRLADRHPAHPA